MSGSNGSGGNDSARAKALARFKSIQSEAEGALNLSKEAEELQLLLEETAQEYDQLADDWYAVEDYVQSDRTRDQAIRVRVFAQEVGNLANMGAEDSRHLVDKVHKALHAYATGQAKAQ